MAARASLAAAARACACALAACAGGWGALVPAVRAAESAASAASAPVQPGAAASAPAVSVSVVRAARRDVAVQVEATGAVSALSSVDIKPQIASVVTAVLVKEGQFVAKGQPLFTLDGRADAANLSRAEAQLLRDQATLADAQRQLARAQELLAKNFISQGAVDTAQTQVEAQRAAVAADQAAIEAARVAVSYSRIVAPSPGRVGQINVFPGSSVAPGGAPMVTITQLDPIAVSFNLPQRNLPDALKALVEAAAAPAAGSPARRPAAGPASAADNGEAAAPAPGRVLAVLPEGRGTRVGRLDFVDSLVDPASGTVRVKALFANRDQALWPGAYVDVRLALQPLAGAVVVPQATIVQGARGTAVFVVDDDSVVAIRPVRVLQALGAEAAVSGLRPGEKVVLDGRQNVRPGSKVVERAAERPAGDPRAAAQRSPSGAVPAGRPASGAERPKP
jgi:RND family efflux transporter MFP subunit